VVATVARRHGSKLEIAVRAPERSRVEPGERTPLLACAEQPSAIGLHHHKGDPVMLYMLAAILLIAWLLGFTAFHVDSGLIHLLVVAAVVIVLFQLITGRRRV